jgi:transcriptional regulator with XRE-family HTH domain
MSMESRIRMARKRLRITKAELAWRWVTFRGRLSRQWEGDDAAPQPAKLTKLRKTLRVTFVWLISGDPI